MQFKPRGYSFLFILTVLLIFNSCSSPDIQKMGQEYCACRKIEMLSGAMQGEQCFNEWDATFGKVSLSPQEQNEFNAILLKCNQVSKQDEVSMEQVESMANEFCYCFDTLVQADSASMIECYQLWELQYRDMQMDNKQSALFNEITEACYPSIPELAIDIDQMALEFCNCFSDEMMLDTIASEKCFKDWEVKYGSLQLTPVQTKKFASKIETCKKTE